MTQALHVFFGVHMGASHQALGAILYNVTKKDLKPSECAVFVNKAWDACKILYSEGSILYWRSPSGAPVSLDGLRQLPNKLSGRLTLPAKAEAQVLKEFEARFKTRMKRLNVAYA